MTYRALTLRSVPGKSPRVHQTPHEREGPDIGEQQGWRRWRIREKSQVGWEERPSRERTETETEGPRKTWWMAVAEGEQE